MPARSWRSSRHLSAPGAADTEANLADLAGSKTCRSSDVNSAGFDSDEWSNAAALDAIGLLGRRWAEEIAGLHADQAQRRPFPDMWSIAEYTDHVREVLFAMRFVLDSALDDPGVDLGAAPEPDFPPTPRLIDIHAVLEGLDGEASALRQRLLELPAKSWETSCRIGDDHVNVHWICRHAVHDADHHLGDVSRPRAAL